MTNVDNRPYSINADDRTPDLAPWALDEDHRISTMSNEAVFTDASLAAVLQNGIS